MPRTPPPLLLVLLAAAALVVPAVDAAEAPAGLSIENDEAEILLGEAGDVRLAREAGGVLAVDGELRVNGTLLHATITRLLERVALLEEQRDALEDIVKDGTVQAFVTGAVSAVDARVDEVNGSVVAVDARVDTVSSSVSAVDARVNEVNGSVVAVDARVDTVSSSVSAVDARVGEVNGSVDAVGARVVALNDTVVALDVTVTDLGANLSSLEPLVLDGGVAAAVAEAGGGTLVNGRIVSVCGSGCDAETVVAALDLIRATYSGGTARIEVEPGTYNDGHFIASGVQGQMPHIELVCNGGDATDCIVNDLSIQVKHSLSMRVTHIGFSRQTTNNVALTVSDGAIIVVNECKFAGYSLSIDSYLFGRAIILNSVFTSVTQAVFRGIDGGNLFAHGCSATAGLAGARPLRANFFSDIVVTDTTFTLFDEGIDIAAASRVELAGTSGAGLDMNCDLDGPLYRMSEAPTCAA